jgi:hypothetical protein
MTDEALITRLAIRHSVSADAVRTVLRALTSGGGRMAQFSHADFGGMSQWSGPSKRSCDTRLVARHLFLVSVVVIVALEARPSPAKRHLRLCDAGRCGRAVYKNSM